VVILQHPRESDVPINTARIAELALSNSTLHVGVDFSQDRELRQTLESSEAPPVLLFPGPGSRDLATEGPEGPVTLVVIDGTWWQASKIFKENPFLRDLPRYGLATGQESRYRIRREPAAHCLSTIEALSAALGVLEGLPNGVPSLLEPFDAMVETQLTFVAREKRPRHRHGVIARERPLVAPVLSERPESLVIGYGEANAWPYGAVDARAPEIVHWAAIRPATGERFEAFVATEGPLAPSFELHSRLLASAVANGEPRAAFLARFAAFLLPNDVLACWGFYASELLRGEGLELPQRLDLREAAIHALGRRVGQLDDYMAAIGVAPAAPWAAGRTGLRLAAMEALVQRLRGARRDDFSLRRKIPPLAETRE